MMELDEQPAAQSDDEGPPPDDAAPAPALHLPQLREIDEITLKIEQLQAAKQRLFHSLAPELRATSSPSGGPPSDVPEEPMAPVGTPTYDQLKDEVENGEVAFLWDAPWPSEARELQERVLALSLAMAASHLAVVGKYAMTEFQRLLMTMPIHFGTLAKTRPDAGFIPTTSRGRHHSMVALGTPKMKK
ncbi:hypothetical protein JL720_16119 [Aureococcus anophagefferens]|nr:hypothetical protein JL720_16119 [Aureococcus anophagefferens]